MNSLEKTAIILWNAGYIRGDICYFLHIDMKKLESIIPKETQTKLPLPKI